MTTAKGRGFLSFNKKLGFIRDNSCYSLTHSYQQLRETPWLINLGIGSKFTMLGIAAVLLQLAAYRTLAYPVNVLEIEKKSANEYHVLVSLVPPYGFYEGETAYRKIRLRDSDFFVDGLEADLAEIDPYDDYFITGDINVARTAVFVDTPYSDQSNPDDDGISCYLRLTRFWP